MAHERRGQRAEIRPRAAVTPSHCPRRLSDVLDGKRGGQRRRACKDVVVVVAFVALWPSVPSGHDTLAINLRQQCALGPVCRERISRSGGDEGGANVGAGRTRGKNSRRRSSSGGRSTCRSFERASPIRARWQCVRKQSSSIGRGRAALLMGCVRVILT